MTEAFDRRANSFIERIFLLSGAGGAWTFIVKNISSDVHEDTCMFLFEIWMQLQIMLVQIFYQKIRF